MTKTKCKYMHTMDGRPAKVTPKDIAKQVARATAIVQTWPAWMRGILEYSSKPHRKDKRSNDHLLHTDQNQRSKEGIHNE